MGTRKMIYISDEEVWESIRLEAGRQRRSISNYLVGLHLGELGKVKPVISGEALVGPKVSKLMIPGVETANNSTSMAKVSAESARARYKVKRPREMCPKCQNFNKDCECD